VRIRAIDWARGLVILLMTVDHAGGVFDATHMHNDDFRMWTSGSPLPTGEFLTRWVTHLCAPTFVLLAGASLAVSAEKRRGQPGQTRFIVTRGLLIAAIDPLWMSLGFQHYQIAVFQVLYAIGMSMVCMAALRKLPSAALLCGATAIHLFGELAGQVRFDDQPWHALWAYLFVGGVPFYGARNTYPLVPWLSIMMVGWVLGRWLLVTRSNASRAQVMALIGAALLAVFVVVRGIDGYGNWHLHRESGDLLQWLHVNKYPPSITYTTLELGLAFLILAGFTASDDPSQPRWLLDGLALYGSTAFFYYLLHVHLLGLAQLILQLDPHEHGLAKTWIAAALDVLVLAGPVWLYRRYKTAHPDGWTRYI
jgi:uncharacterized membrane protein